METTLIVAIISAATSLLGAALSYFFAKRQEAESQWRNQKLASYRELLTALSEAAIHGINDDKAQERFANAFNTIGLVAPQSVISVLLAFHDEIQISNPNPSRANHDKLLTELVEAIRRDLKVTPEDDPRSFRFRLIGRKVGKAA